MGSKVYFMPCQPAASEAELQKISRAVLSTLLEREKIALAPQIPLKVHFGEAGNRTYLKPALYDGILAYFKERQIENCFMETSVLYGGRRFSREKHLALAAEHGFTQCPVIIADGQRGEEAFAVPVNLKHFEKCMIAAALASSEQVLVVSHFKGHMLAGFGGAIKQLSMGFAAKGGKLAMHMGVKPRVVSLLCRGCGLCAKRCNENAISFTPRHKAKIDHAKCVGCGACFSICPAHAVSILSLAGLKNALFGGRLFREKLVEYAYASSHGKRHLYLTFAVSITKGCDCEPHPMKPCVPDLGVFASTDPVAIDAACYDAVAAHGRKFKGAEQLAYAERIGLGTRSYDLVTLQAD